MRFERALIMRHDGSISVNLPKVVTDCEFWINAKSVELDFSEEKNIIIIKPIREDKNE